jgi:sporadic carbohydrate cluster protein (TIGR04323 family)
MNSPRYGHRGYIGSRPYDGNRTPQHVQNLVIRDYCQKHGHDFLLSATEYAMPACYMMLEEVISEAPTLEGVVLYSLFMLPEQEARRRDFCRRILAAEAGLHGAVENLEIRSEADFARIEDIWRARSLALNTIPDAALYAKGDG